MIDTVKVDDRIELIESRYTTVKQGDRGTVTHVVFSTVTDEPIALHVRWDNGSQLAVVLDEDSVRVLDKEEER